jgi:hypothetical protein
MIPVTVFPGSVAIFSILFTVSLATMLLGGDIEKFKEKRGTEYDRL